MTTPAIRIPIDAQVGGENTQVGSSSFYLFWLPPVSRKLPKPEIGMDSAIKLEPSLRREFHKVHDAMLDRGRDAGGSWTDARYTVGEGTVLKVWGEKTSWGVPQGKAAVILLCSAQAPVSRVTLPLIGLPTCSRQAVTITGQFFVLNRDTVGEYAGIPPLTDQAKHYSSPVFITEVFKIEECIPAPQKPIAEKKVTTTVDTGGTVKAAGTSAGGTIILRTNKTRRVLG